MDDAVDAAQGFRDAPTIANVAEQELDVRRQPRRACIFSVYLLNQSIKHANFEAAF